MCCVETYRKGWLGVESFSSKGEACSCGKVCDLSEADAVERTSAPPKKALASSSTPSSHNASYEHQRNGLSSRLLRKYSIA